MGGGASSQAKQARAGYEPPALRRPSIVQLAKKNRVPYQLMEIVDKRFHQLDKRKKGTITTKDIPNTGNEQDDRVIAHVFKHGLGKSGGGGGRSMEDFAKPLRVFSPDGAIDKKLHWVFMVLSQGKNELSRKQVEAFCSLAGVDMDDGSDFVATLDAGTISRDKFVSLVVAQLKQLPEDVSRQLFRLPYNTK